MTDHGARDHATWSASATARNWACPGALALSAAVEHLDRESHAAAWGTACHQVAEKCLLGHVEALSFIDTVETTRAHQIEVDDELAATAQMYVDYVRQAMRTSGSAWIGIEERFSLHSLNPPFDAGGTCDAVLYDKAASLLEVVDLKGGRGIAVEAEGNMQLRTYALGAMLLHPHLNVKQVKVTIVQPRIGHAGGRIRSETFHVVDLMEWTQDLLAAMDRSHTAMVLFSKMDGAPEWRAEYLHPGAHCQFCPAAGICPALEQKALDDIGVWFDDESQPHFANAPDSLDPGNMARILDAADLIEGYINSVRRLATALAESGVEIPNYQLVEKIGHRKWHEWAVESLLRMHEDGVDIYVAPKMKSPAQLEKTLGAKRKGTIADLWHAPVTGRGLARIDKTTRPAAKPIVDAFDTIPD